MDLTASRITGPALIARSDYSGTSGALSFLSSLRVLTHEHGTWSDVGTDGTAEIAEPCLGSVC
jgi:hypothetical protein